MVPIGGNCRNAPTRQAERIPCGGVGRLATDGRRKVKYGEPGFSKYLSSALDCGRYSEGDSGKGDDISRSDFSRYVKVRREVSPVVKDNFRATSGTSDVPLDIGRY